MRLYKGITYSSEPASEAISMLDRFGRTLDYLRISVTDRCNLRCDYCMPGEPVAYIPSKDQMTFSEIMDVVHEGADLGFRKVRLTGGEPLVRPGIVELVRMLSELNRLEIIALTTNGVLLAKFAQDLSKAGLNRLNISLDTVDPRRFWEITRGGDLSNVLRGIEAALAAGFNPIKINCVVEQSSSEEDARGVAAYAESKNLEVRYIHRMDLESGRFGVVEGGSGGHCASCSRLRLSSDGYIRPCLFSDLAFSVRALGPREAILQAADSKPESGQRSLTGKFSLIGG